MLDDIKYDDDAKTLTRLGLTSRQSKVYLMLSVRENATINTLSSSARMDRANVYRTIKQLLDLGLVESFITNPATFKALPMSEGIKLLLERRKKEYEQSEVQAKELLNRHRQAGINSEIERKAQFALVPGGKLTYRKIAELVDSSQTSHHGIIYGTDLEKMTDFFVALFRKLLQKGVKIELAIFLETKEKLPKEFDALKSYQDIEIREAATRPRTTFSIWDKKKAFLTVEPQISQPMIAGLFIDNATVVGLLLDYFELIWLDSKRAL